MSDRRLEALSQNADFARATIQAALASDGRALHAETAIASASRMSGTMLFRSFGLDLRNFRPGTVALSAAADTDGPMAMGLMFSALRAMGHDISDTRFKPTSLTTSVSQLTLLQTQELLDPPYLAYCKATSTSYRDVALASAVAAGIMVHDFRQLIAVEDGASLALFGLIEGAKSFPRESEADQRSKSTGEAALHEAPGKRKLWFKFW